MVARILLAGASVLALATLTTTAQAAPKEPLVLRPKGGWTLDMAENKCRIARAYGEGEDASVFYLEQWGPSQRAYWALAGKPVDRFKSGWDAKFAFGPEGDGETFLFTPLTFGTIGNLIGRTSSIVRKEGSGSDYEDTENNDWQANPRGLPALDATSAQGIDKLTLSQSGRSDLVVELNGLKPAMQAMNACVEDLVKYWGLDPAEQRSIVTPPRITNIRAVASRVMQEYPSAALRAGAQAAFHLRLMVGVDGSVEDCALVNQTVAEGFDMRKGPCAVFKQYAEVVPAADASGKAVKSYYTTRVVYSINR